MALYFIYAKFGSRMRKAFRATRMDPEGTVGRLLSFVPVLNVLALGYLIEYAQRLRRLTVNFRNGEIRIFRPFSSKAFGHLLFFYLILEFPCWVLLSKIFDFFTFGLLGIVSYFPIAISGFIGPFLFLSAIHAYLRDGIFSDVWQIRSVLKNAQKLWPRLAIPVIAFWGIFLLAIPLYGISFFLGLWVLLSYSTVLQFSE